MWRWTGRMEWRCHQLMELGRGSSEKCFEICRKCLRLRSCSSNVASLRNAWKSAKCALIVLKISTRNIFAGKVNSATVMGVVLLRHFKWTLSTNSFVNWTTKQIHTWFMICTKKVVLLPSFKLKAKFRQRVRVCSSVLGWVLQNIALKHLYIWHYPTSQM